MDDAVGEVEALAARDGVVVAVGTNGEIDAYRGSETRVIDLEGRLATPGFTEGHGHFTGIGRSLLNIDLRAARSWDEVVEIIRAEAAEREPGDWILGWGWHQEKWDTPVAPAVEGYPVHDALSAAVPDNPVLLKHAAGSHAGIVNARVLDIAGIDDSTPDPPGGTILRHPDGRATGVLRETAYSLALRAYDDAMDRLDNVELERFARREIELANEECLTKGVTTMHDAGSSFDDVERFRRMYDEGRLDVRLWVMLNESNEELAKKMASFRTVGAAGGHLTVRAIKRVADGALGTHGAWLLEPYEDHDSVGLPTTPVESLRETARLAREHDYQLCIHAIGDRANREVLDVFEEAYAGDADLRWRIEHAQHLSLDDIPRFGELGVIASMQGVHCTSDAPWVPRRLGDRRAEEGAYVWRKLMESGATIVNGTDAPVEDVDPIANFISTVTRRDRHGNVFYGDQAMTRMESLASMTTNAAYAAFEEDTQGKLIPGMLADIVVLSQDILTVDENALAATRVEHTIVGGKLLYSAE
ncbi:MAG: amidohydrolase family protein [Acidobacteria bacterium]|nr:amidohydrolase family protein [Acidobacteriota bacterium]NIM61422.1 amidohydrolase family protein [Acidobacteriota bacterium]NIO58085.1 amidohydrolase family protein [Acidobacteriota bacterium]NIQ29094.1 amidohydrolase family protein [Acidobacteriota bacterium]NIQ83638.1 amidohydrolase family protein [Acidobacteriota bacterium]